jgi:hypothetical protein
LSQEKSGNPALLFWSTRAKSKLILAWRQKTSIPIPILCPTYFPVKPLIRDRCHVRRKARRQFLTTTLGVKSHPRGEVGTQGWSWPLDMKLSLGCENPLFAPTVF